MTDPNPASVSATPARALSPSAVRYLESLGAAVELARLELDEARAAERRLALMTPVHYSTSELEASSVPEQVIHGRIRDAAAARWRRAERTFAFAAWWWAAGAIQALTRKAAGHQVTGRILEQATEFAIEVTLNLPAAEREELEADSRMWPDLPEVGQYASFKPHLDVPMNDALEALRRACLAADFADDFQQEIDSHPNGRTADWETSQLHDAYAEAARIPELLVTYAAAATEVARWEGSR